MNQIILASHSKLASGMMETVCFFGGDNVEVLEQTMTDTGFEEKVSQILEKHRNKNCIVFTDLYGGSVNQIFFRKLANTHFHLITGMNLAVILECIFTKEDIDEDFIRKAIKTSKEQFCYMNDYLKMSMDEDED